MEEVQKKPTESTLDSSLSSTQEHAQKQPVDQPKSPSNPIDTETNPDSHTDLSQATKRRKTSEEDTTISSASHHALDSKPEIKTNHNNQSLKIPVPVHYQDTTFHDKNVGYCSFSATNKVSTESTSTTKTESIQSNPIQQLLHDASTISPDLDSEEEDEQKKKLAAARQLLFPGALATSFTEVADTLRNERRQEFCPIYKDETPEQRTLRLSKQKPVGSLLAKRIRWDDLKRKRDDEERKAQMQYRYGPYGPVYNNHPSEQSLANPYEQYYTAMQNQYDLMVKMTHAQQEHSGFWPEYQQSPFQNNDQIRQNAMQHQAQPYTYPYPYASMQSNNTSGMNINPPSSYTPADYYNLHSISHMQPPPPPPDEPE